LLLAKVKSASNRTHIPIWDNLKMDCITIVTDFWNAINIFTKEASREAKRKAMAALWKKNSLKKTESRNTVPLSSMKEFGIMIAFKEQRSRATSKNDCES
jgi:hypothetical protein